MGCLAAFAWLRKAGPFAGTLRDDDSDAAALQRVPFRLFADPANARFVGTRYLKFYPDRALKEFVLQDLGSDFTALALRDDPALEKYIADRQRRDFSRGNTVIVDNWILSRTEASLCALAVLSS